MHWLGDAVLVSVLAAAVRIATPLLLAAIGELIVERAGVLNLGLEGMMLAGCFCGYAAAYGSGSAVTGIVVAMAAGATVGLLFALLTVTLKVDQILTGLVINLLAAGTTLFFFRVLQASAVAGMPTIAILPPLPVPWLADLPLLGPALFQHTVLTYLALALIPATWFFLQRTRYGLELRGLGENPRALDVRGLSVDRRRYLAVIFGGVMAGLAGAAISVGGSVNFVPDMTAGRGWLAIVIVVAGRWRLPWVCAAVAALALLESLQLQLLALDIAVPRQALLALPYVAAIAVLLFDRRGQLAPAMLGRPYSRE